MTTRASVVASVLRRAARLDREWLGKVAQGDEERRLWTPWMPFSLGEFTMLLAESLAAYEPGADENVTFLEIGCGPGPKLLVARDVFGLDAYGFDRVADYVAAARTLGLPADTGDAVTFAGYGRAAITWFNRVARDAGIQAQIEAKVWRDTAPGSVVMCANLEAPPPASWFPVVDDWEARRGAWMKPGQLTAGW